MSLPLENSSGTDPNYARTTYSRCTRNSGTRTTVRRRGGRPRLIPRRIASLTYIYHFFFFYRRSAVRLEQFYFVI